MNKRKLRYLLLKPSSENLTWGFRIQSLNGNVIVTNGGYARRANAIKTLNLLKPSKARIEQL